MAIEVKVKDNVQNECHKLMINTRTNSIILAVKINNIGIEGICINSSESASIGEYASNWRSDLYIDYNGEVTLRNK